MDISIELLLNYAKYFRKTWLVENIRGIVRNTTSGKR